MIEYTWWRGITRTRPMIHVMYKQTRDGDSLCTEKGYQDPKKLSRLVVERIDAHYKYGWVRIISFCRNRVTLESRTDPRLTTKRSHQPTARRTAKFHLAIPGVLTYHATRMQASTHTYITFSQVTQCSKQPLTAGNGPVTREYLTGLLA